MPLKLELTIFCFTFTTSKQLITCDYETNPNTLLVYLFVYTDVSFLLS